MAENKLKNKSFPISRVLFVIDVSTLTAEFLLLENVLTAVEKFSSIPMEINQDFSQEQLEAGCKTWG